MKTRIIIHYYNGMTWTGDWDESVNFKELNQNPISSLQIQQEDGKYHTLSLKKRKAFKVFWQRDIIQKDRIINRNILRKLSKDIWIDLNLDCITGKRKVTIIREDIKVT